MKVSSNMKPSPSPNTFDAIDQDFGICPNWELPSRGDNAVSRRTDRDARQACRRAAALQTWRRAPSESNSVTVFGTACVPKEEIIVPFEIKALPAALEERIKTPVVVLGCCPDEALVEQPYGFVTDRLPIVPEFCQFRKAVNRDHPAGSESPSLRTSVRCRGEERRVIAELTPKTLAPAEMYVNWCRRRECKCQQAVARKAV